MMQFDDQCVLIKLEPGFKNLFFWYVAQLTHKCASYPGSTIMMITN